MKLWKQIALIAIMSTIMLGCKTSNQARMNAIKQKVGNNECLYKGGYGIIANDLYLRKDDGNNNIYTSSNTIFAGKEKSVTQLVYIKKPISPDPVNVEMEDFQLPNEGVVILFSSDFVYIMNMSSQEYFKYRRD
jgi:hypothetical protein